MIVRDHLPWNRVWPQVSKRLSVLFLFDLTVSLLYSVAHWEFISQPSLPLVSIGSAITVFLAFRTNSAYGRWWEARQLWGALVNSSRSVARQALTFIRPQGSTPDDPPSSLSKEIVMLQIAFVCALRCHLRKQNPFPELTGLLDEAVVERLRQHKNVPAGIMLESGKRMRAAFDRGWVDSYRWVAMDKTLSDLTDVQGACERIKNTPLPRQYDYFPRLLVSGYCLLLPFGLVGGLGMLTPVASTTISFIFVLLDQLGREIETPFENTVHDTPMTALSRTIEINLRQLMGETRVPPEVQPVDGFVY